MKRQHSPGCPALLAWDVTGACNCAGAPPPIRRCAWCERECGRVFCTYACRSEALLHLTPEAYRSCFTDGAA